MVGLAGAALLLGVSILIDRLRLVRLPHDRWKLFGRRDFRGSLFYGVLQNLQALTDIKYLCLENCDVTDQGLLYLRNMKKVHWLNLYGTKVTDEGLPILHQLPQLKTLFLPRSISDQALEALQKQLPNCSMGRWEPPATVG